MRVAALGDAHLGRSYLPFTTPEGVNQREHDFEVSFEAAVDLDLVDVRVPGLDLGDAEMGEEQVRAIGVP